MNNIEADGVLNISASEIQSFSTVDTHFKIPMVSDKESSASIRTVVIDNDFTFKGLCMEGLAYEVGAVLDMQSGIVYHLVMN